MIRLTVNQHTDGEGRLAVRTTLSGLNVPATAGAEERT